MESKARQLLRQREEILGVERFFTTPGTQQHIGGKSPPDAFFEQRQHRTVRGNAGAGRHQHIAGRLLVFQNEAAIRPTALDHIAGRQSGQKPGRAASFDRRHGDFHVVVTGFVGDAVTAMDFFAVVFEMNVDELTGLVG